MYTKPETFPLFITGSPNPYLLLERDNFLNPVLNELLLIIDQLLPDLRRLGEEIEVHLDVHQH